MISLGHRTTVPQPPVNLPADAKCLACRYPLAGVAQAVCPECGRAFDALDRSTFGPGGGQWLARWGLRGPGWGTFVCAGGVTVMSGVAGSVPLLAVEWLFFAFLGGMAVSVLCAIRALVAFGAAARRPADRATLARSWRRWTVLVGLGLLCIYLVVGKPVWQLRWIVSRPALDALAADVRAGASVTSTRVYGAISVSHARVAGSDIRVTFDGGGFMITPVSTVLVNSPGRPPALNPGEAILWSSGDWYLVIERF